MHVFWLSDFNSTPINPNIVQNLSDENCRTGSLKNESLTTSPDVDGGIPLMHQKNDVEKSERTPAMNTLISLDCKCE